MNKTFLFYDIETSGLNKAFDQVLQFAAIRTDLNCNELERHEIFVRLSPDTVPAPQAILIHQLSITELNKTGVAEIEAIKRIHQLMNQPGTISIGYNSLGFDDEFLRFSFYRNLLPPYTHQYANECGRADLYPMAILYFLYQPTVLNWPTVNGKASFKLEQLNLANQLSDGAAHNAMVDVQATVALAKRLQQDNAMWQYALGYFNKKIMLERLVKLPQEALLFDGGLRVEQFYQCPVLRLGEHAVYKNKQVWLRLDKPELTDANSNNIAEKTWAFMLKPGEDLTVLPLTEHYSKYLTPERQQVVSKNKTWLANNPEIFQAIKTYHQQYIYPKIPNLDIDAALYENGFLTDVEIYWCSQFHQVGPEEKLKLIQSVRNNNIREQAIRIMGRNFSNYLTPELQEEFDHYLKKINPDNGADALVDYRGRKRLTPKAALVEIAELKNKGALNQQQLELLQDLELHLHAITSQKYFA
jgi:exodeoxyribonuclease-1